MKTISLTTLFMVLTLAWTSIGKTVETDFSLPAGERPHQGINQGFEEPRDRPHYLKLVSGKLFKRDGASSYTSSDEGKTWLPGGKIKRWNPTFSIPDVHIQIRSGKYRGRIVIPFYLGMYGRHPNYTRQQRGGYAIWKGKKISLETHTHVPEMSGSYVSYSDDEGETWKTSNGFMMGYFKDGHMGHMTCEEPVVAELKDGRLLCFMRSTCGRILKSYSSDGGQNWTKVELTDLPMSNSPCALKRLPATGDLVLVWNQMSVEEIKRGYRRGRLSIAISKDDGQTWHNFKTLELSPGLETAIRVEPPELTAMVRGPSGPGNLMGEIPDDFKHYGYPRMYLSEDKLFVVYSVSPPAGPGSSSRWRTFSVSWLYEE